MPMWYPQGVSAIIHPPPLPERPMNDRRFSHRQQQQRISISNITVTIPVVPGFSSTSTSTSTNETTKPVPPRVASTIDAVRRVKSAGTSLARGRPKSYNTIELGQKYENWGSRRRSAQDFISADIWCQHDRSTVRKLNLVRKLSNRVCLMNPSSTATSTRLNRRNSKSTVLMNGTTTTTTSNTTTTTTDTDEDLLRFMTRGRGDARRLATSQGSQEARMTLASKGAPSANKRFFTATAQAAAALVECRGKNIQGPGSSDFVANDLQKNKITLKESSGVNKVTRSFNNGVKDKPATTTPQFSSTTTTTTTTTTTKPPLLSKMFGFNYCDPRIFNGIGSGRVRNPAQNMSRVGMRVSVIGANKCLRGGRLPYQNRSLDNGDFGDDAGMMFENNDCCFIALADGAGGNRSQGIDPSIFSKNLMASCHRLLRSTAYNSQQLPQLLTAAMKKVETLNILGSATVCAVALDRKRNQLNTLNIGDSGVKVIRNNRIVFRTKRTMNGSSPCQLFNIDHTDLYKMGVAPTSFVRESEIRADSSIQSVPVKVGDIVIISSDGLWDVMSEANMLRIVDTYNKRGGGIAEISEALFNAAVRCYHGGSRDDILIIAARIKSAG